MVLDGVLKGITEATASGWVGCNDYVSLVGEDLGVPAAAPGVEPRALRSTVDVVEKGVGLGLVEVLGVDNPGLDLPWLLARSEKYLSSGICTLVQLPS